MKKAHISPTIKCDLWKHHFGESQHAKCLSCYRVTINALSFHAGHIIPEKLGGETVKLNLLPICKTCNLKNGSNCTLIEYAKKTHDVDILLDDVYKAYQDNAMIQYKKNCIFYRQYLVGGQQQQIANIIPVLNRLIDDNLLNPDWSNDSYSQFIREKTSDKSNIREDKLTNLQIGENVYDVYIRSKLCEPESIRDFKLKIEMKHSEFPKVVWEIEAASTANWNIPSIQFKKSPLWLKCTKCYKISN